MMMPCLPNCSVPAEKERDNCCARRLGHEVKEGLFVTGLLTWWLNAIVGSASCLLVAQLVFLFTNEWKRINVSNVEKGSLPT
jgi:hypothetical protein